MKNIIIGSDHRSPLDEQKVRSVAAFKEKFEGIGKDIPLSPVRIADGGESRFGEQEWQRRPALYEIPVARVETKIMAQPDIITCGEMGEFIKGRALLQRGTNRHDKVEYQQSCHNFPRRSTDRTGSKRWGGAETIGDKVFKIPHR